MGEKAADGPEPALSEYATLRREGRIAKALAASLILLKLKPLE